jgi:hypothetical protein
VGITKDIQSKVDIQNLPLESVNAKDTHASIRRFNIPSTLSATVQIVLKDRTGSGAASVWTVRVSLDGAHFAALTPSVTLSPDTITDIIDVSGYLALEVALTTASTYTTETVNIIVSRQS